MKNPESNPSHYRKPLSLHPLSLDEALRAALKTPLPGKKPRAEAKPQGRK